MKKNDDVIVRTFFCAIPLLASLSLSGCFMLRIVPDSDYCTNDPRDTVMKLCTAKGKISYRSSPEEIAQAEAWESQAKPERAEALAECAGVKRELRKPFYPERDLYCDY